jgi:hypothetical protein
MLRDKTEEWDFKRGPLGSTVERTAAPASGEKQQLFFYAPQRVGIQEMLKPFMAEGRVVLIPVDEHNINRMRGLHDQTFVILTRHSSQIPTTLHEAIAAGGYTIWHLDDVHARRCYRQD